MAEGGGLLRLPEITEQAGIFEIRPVFYWELGWRWAYDDHRTAFGHTGGHTRPHSSSAKRRDLTHRRSDVLGVRRPRTLVRSPTALQMHAQATVHPRLVPGSQEGAVTQRIAVGLLVVRNDSARGEASVAAPAQWSPGAARRGTEDRRAERPVSCRIAPRTPCPCSHEVGSARTESLASSVVLSKPYGVPDADGTKARPVRGRREIG